jgi:hypothetical protein
MSVAPDKESKRRSFWRKKPKSKAAGAAIEPTESASRVEAPDAAAPPPAPPPPVPAVAPAPEALEKKSDRKKAPWISRSKRFRKWCDVAFDIADTDGDGSVDDKELYLGLLLIHLKLGTMAGPAACRPLGRERCQAVFRKFDADSSGSLDRDEFRDVMVVLFGNVIFRVIVQWCMTLMIVPFVARSILDGIYKLIGAAMQFVENLDEYSEIANKIELFVEGVRDWFYSLAPTFYDKMITLLEKVPDSVWNAIPLALISLVLGVLVVPWIIFKVDDFFQYLADRRAKEKEKTA